jgi:hypothetical protein
MFWRNIWAKSQKKFEKLLFFKRMNPLFKWFTNQTIFQAQDLKVDKIFTKICLSCCNSLIRITTRRLVILNINMSLILNLFNSRWRSLLISSFILFRFYSLTKKFSWIAFRKRMFNENSLFGHGWLCRRWSRFVVILRNHWSKTNIWMKPYICKWTTHFVRTPIHTKRTNNKVIL